MNDMFDQYYFQDQSSNLKSNTFFLLSTSMLNFRYYLKKSIPRRLTLWKAWDGFLSVGFGFDRWMRIYLPPIWYVCLGNINWVENGLWWIAHRARWVKVVWGDPVSSRKWTLTNFLICGCIVGIETNNRLRFPIIAP